MLRNTDALRAEKARQTSEMRGIDNWQISRLQRCDFGMQHGVFAVMNSCRVAPWHLIDCKFIMLFVFSSAKWSCYAFVTREWQVQPLCYIGRDE